MGEESWTIMVGVSDKEGPKASADEALLRLSEVNLKVVLSLF